MEAEVVAVGQGRIALPRQDALDDALHPRVAQSLRQAVQMVFRQYFPTTDFKQVIEWFELGGNLKLSDVEPTSAMLSRMEHVQGLFDKLEVLGAGRDSSPDLRAAAAEMILEGLHSIDKINRSEERGFTASDRKAAQDLYRDYTVERNRYKKPLN